MSCEHLERQFSRICKQHAGKLSDDKSILIKEKSTLRSIIYNIDFILDSHSDDDDEDGPRDKVVVDWLFVYDFIFNRFEKIVSILKLEDKTLTILSDTITRLHREHPNSRYLSSRVVPQSNKIYSMLSKESWDGLSEKLLTSIDKPYVQEELNKTSNNETKSTSKVQLETVTESDNVRTPITSMLISPKSMIPEKVPQKLTDIGHPLTISSPSPSLASSKQSKDGKQLHHWRVLLKEEQAKADTAKSTPIEQITEQTLKTPTTTKFSIPPHKSMLISPEAPRKASTSTNHIYSDSSSSESDVNLSAAAHKRLNSTTSSNTTGGSKYGEIFDESELATLTSTTTSITQTQTNVTYASYEDEEDDDSGNDYSLLTSNPDKLFDDKKKKKKTGFFRRR